MELQQRFITNQYDQYKEGQDLNELKQLTKDLLIKNIEIFNADVDPNLPINMCVDESKNTTDISIFMGAGGNLYVYLKLYNFFNHNKQMFNQEYNSQRYLNQAQICFQKLVQEIQNQGPLEKQQKPNITFYMSSAGIYTLGAQLAYYLQDINLFKECVQNVLQYKTFIIKNQNDKRLYFELLYGVGGYLYCLLFLQKNFVLNIKDEAYTLEIQKDIMDICQLIVQRGINSYSQFKKNLKNKNTRLHYTFYGYEYIGAAHGTMGITYLLLKSIQINKQYFLKNNKQLYETMINQIQLTYDTILGLQFPNGNFPSIFDETESDLVQFCHGSPGIVPSLMEAFLFFNEDRYRVSAIKALENVWQEGLIKKGFNLCHGITGNAYSFLSMHRITGDQNWLYQALKFILSYTDKRIIESTESYDISSRLVKGKSDYPYSLMMGIGGNICAICDCLDSENGAFPGYEI